MKRYRRECVDCTDARCEPSWKAAECAGRDLSPDEVAAMRQSQWRRRHNTLAGVVVTQSRSQTHDNARLSGSRTQAGSSMLSPRT